MRTLERARLFFMVFAGLSCGAVAAGTAHGQDRFTLEAAVQRAIERSPSVIAAEADVDAARAIQSGAALLLQDNPEVEFAAGTRRNGEEESPEYEISIAQPLDLIGRRGARKDAATAALAAAEARLTERKASVAAQVRDLFGRALAAEQHVRLAADGVTLAAEGLAGAEARYEAGSASLIELNTARVEVGRNKRARLSAERARAAADAELRLLLATDGPHALSLDGDLPAAVEDREPAREELLGLAIERRPDLIAARFDLESARGEESLASREAFPLPKLGASFAKEEDAEIVLGLVTWDLPLFNRNQAARGLGRARVRQLEVAVSALERQVVLEVELAFDRLRAAREALDGFTGADLAAVDENIALTTEGYEAGQIDFLQLLLVRREMLEVRSGYIDALAELNSAEADLDRSLGIVTGLPAGR